MATQPKKFKKYTSYPFKGTRYEIELWNAVTLATVHHYQNHGLNPLDAVDNPQIDVLRDSYRHAQFDLSSELAGGWDDPMGEDLDNTLWFIHISVHGTNRGYWLGKFGKDTCGEVKPMYLLSDNEMFTLYKKYVMHTAFISWRNGVWAEYPEIKAEYPQNDHELYAFFQLFRATRTDAPYLGLDVEGIHNVI